MSVVVGGSKRSRLFKVALAVAVLMAACVLLLVEMGKPARGAFSGSNGKIVFASNRDSAPSAGASAPSVGSGTFDIYTMNADGSGVTRLTNDPANDIYPAWSPDGKKIAFASNRDGNTEIYTMNADGTNQTNITNNPANDSSPAWSPDGTRVAFASDRGNNLGVDEVYTMNSDGTGVANISNLNPQSSEPGRVDREPSWSPDGTKIAFHCYVNGSSHEICVMNADGTNRRQLTSSPQGTYDDYAKPDWSPDGTQIAFDGFLAGGGSSDSQIRVMSPEGTAQSALTDSSQNFYPSWSPDGKKIAFGSSRDGNAEIYTMSADGTQQVNITNNPARDSFPSWQPVSLDNVSLQAAAGDAVSTATGDGSASVADPVNTTVITPVGGTVTITESSNLDQSIQPSGFSFLGEQINIEAPQATVQNPLSLTFVVDSSLMPSGTDYTNLQLFRNGVRVEPCEAGPSSTIASPDPCIKQRTQLAGDAQITVLSSHASAWNVGVAQVGTPLYSFKGFSQPVDKLPTVNTVKAGNAIPVKFSLGGNKGLDIFSAGYPLSGRVPDDPNAPLDAIEQTVTANSSGLSYDVTSGQYTYVWKTEKAWAGQTRELVMRLKDGTEHKANFKFAK